MFKLIFSLLLAFSLSAEINVLAFSGSLRENSENKKLLNEAVKIAREMGANVTVIDLKNYPMPFYDADVESSQGMPEKAKELRNLMIKSQAMIIASPEYNGSLSGVLKNTIDWASRDENGSPSRNAFKDKKILLLSTSPGQGGGARGLIHLRAILQNIGALTLPDSFSTPNTPNYSSPQLRELVKKLLEE